MNEASKPLLLIFSITPKDIRRKNVIVLGRWYLDEIVKEDQRRDLGKKESIERDYQQRTRLAQR